MSSGSRRGIFVLQELVMISVEGVSKRYGQVSAVDQLSFSVQRGEVVGFLGPNGAGKTTTMRMITGTLQPDEGSVLLDGTSVADDPMAAKRRIGYLPEANPLYDELIVAEYLEYIADLRGMSPEETRSGVADAVEETDIGEVFYRPISECSKGYRQRIGLAGAILHRPEVLVLDEPTEGLDPNQRVEIRRLVGSLGRERTVLLSTHAGSFSRFCRRRNGHCRSRLQTTDRSSEGLNATILIRLPGLEATSTLIQLCGSRTPGGRPLLVLYHFAG
jgi:ABC-type multidrug transport system ATPase subunit